MVVPVAVVVVGGGVGVVVVVVVVVAVAAVQYLGRSKVTLRKMNFTFQLEERQTAKIVVV
jgi:hypothetical protein